MKYVVYLTVNTKSQINGINRIYVGVYKTNNPSIFDGYLGCGVYVNLASTFMYPKNPFQYAVKKYGVLSFYRYILFVYDNIEDAYNKEAEIVNEDFIKQDFTYNTCLGGRILELEKPIYQFDLNGKLIKRWDKIINAITFYNRTFDKFTYAIKGKYPLVDSLWSYNESINLEEYSTKPWNWSGVVYLYSKNGKWLREFVSKKACAEYLNVDEDIVNNAIKNQKCILNKYYVSNKMTDLFKAKPRRQLIRTTLFIYQNGEYLGAFKGKSVMPVLGTFSWTKISNAIENCNGWYKDFYISEVQLSNEEIPTKKPRNNIQIDIYTKYGDFIETLNSIQEVKNKYKVPASKMKDIQLGNKYFGDYIFKYHSS